MARPFPNDCARLERALDLPKGAAVSDLVIETPVFAPSAGPSRPTWRLSAPVTPSTWYIEAFSATPP